MIIEGQKRAKTRGSNAEAARKLSGSLAEAELLNQGVPPPIMMSELAEEGEQVYYF